MTSFPVQVGGVEVGHATFFLPGSDAVVRGTFAPGPAMKQWDALLDRAADQQFVVVDSHTGTRVAIVTSLYGPAGRGRDAWQIVARFDSAPGLPANVE